MIGVATAVRRRRHRRTAIDSFTEATTIAIASHTADLGGGWTNWNGSINVQGGTGRAVNNSNSSGNRSNLTLPVGGTQFDVSANFTVPGVSGNAYFAGPSARHSALNSTDGYELFWSRQFNRLELNVTNVVVATAALAYPGDGARYTLRIRNGLVIGLVNGVELISIVSDVNPTSQVAGFVLGSFVSGSLGTVQARDFAVDLYS